MLIYLVPFRHSPILLYPIQPKFSLCPAIPAQTGNSYTPASRNHTHSTCQSINYHFCNLRKYLFLFHSATVFQHGTFHTLLALLRKIHGDFYNNILLSADNFVFAQFYKNVSWVNMKTFRCIDHMGCKRRKHT